MNIKPKDIIATVAILILVGLKVYQNQGDIDSIVTMILGYYFAKRTQGTDTGV